MIYIAILLLFPFSFFFPWWGFVPPCFLLGLKARSIIHCFATGFVSLFSVWLVASYVFNVKSHGLMAGKMSMVFPLQGSSWLMLLSTAFVGGILGALWSLVGYLFYHRIWKAAG